LADPFAALSSALSDRYRLERELGPDGNRFLLVTPVRRPGAEPVVVILHWLDQLNAKAAK